MSQGIRDGYGNDQYYGEVSGLPRGAHQSCTLIGHEDLIACIKGHICAFYQNGASGNLEVALQHVEKILDYGCDKCGSVPVSGNDVADGELTVNWMFNGDVHFFDENHAGVLCSARGVAALSTIISESVQ